MNFKRFERVTKRRKKEKMRGEVLILLPVSRVAGLCTPAIAWTTARTWTPVTVGPATEESPVTAWVPARALIRARAWTPVTAWIFSNSRHTINSKEPATPGRPAMEMLNVKLKIYKKFIAE